MMTSEITGPTCQVCRTSYTYSGPEPYLLPCLHSVCNSCLESSADSTLSCPECRETFLKTYKAKDAVTAKAVFLKTAEKDGSQMLCSNREDGNQASVWCSECEALLCDQCQASHSEYKSSRDHHVKTLEDLVKHQKDCLRKPHCFVHKDYPLVIFDHDCDLMLCLMCKMQKHQGCDVGSVDEVYRYLRGQTLPEYISKLTEKMAVNNTCETSLVEFEDQVERSRGDLKVSIRNTFQELHHILQEREQEVTSRVDQHLDRLKKENSLSLVEVRLMTERCDTVLEFSQKSMKLSTPADLFNMKKTIEARTTACTRAKLPMQRSMDCLPLFHKRGLDELKTTLKDYTCIAGDYPEVSTDDVKDREPQPDQEVHPAKSREQQETIWKKELEMVERDILELKLILERHERHVTELKKNLKIGTFRQAVSSFLNTIRGRRSYSVLN